jgi:heme exporter protein B
MLRPALTILQKDLRIELRTRESVPTMALFAVIVFVLLHFGLDRDTLDGDLAAGVLWVTLLLATILAVNRLFVAEREQGGLDGLLLAPVDRTALYLAKAAALFLYLLLLELVAVPTFGLLLLAPDLVGALPELIVVLLVADLGLAAIGALVAALAAETRVRELIVPLFMLPLLVPIVIAGASASEPLLAVPQGPDGLGGWLAFLALYDVVFMLIALGVFDFLVED